MTAFMEERTHARLAWETRRTRMFILNGGNTLTLVEANGEISVGLKREVLANGGVRRENGSFAPLTESELKSFREMLGIRRRNSRG